ncbi:hypothetical protein Dvina_15355 [Dactylosporangium vinaceum]|uniref:Clp protease N-terminal domain-containing protein n=1 Tax=Dactylosporangium vinaceum TaxID=53362 RepID=A0ABV5M202_9ACTN|nr:Clp protease N-terminal domain-containing protein [Dactylosporangium vinaceum]UAB99329.1 hypothetical protein Dvina_15355 [Dactylosporangium vinaceum]
MLDRLTTEARAAVTRAAGPTPQALAEALATYRTGNTATIWTTPLPAAPAHPPSAPELDADASAVLDRARALNPDHVGTEHLLAALVRSDHPDVVAWLAAQGATADAVDRLLADLDGGLGVESPPAKGSFSLSPAWTVAITIAVVIVLFVLCIWGP